MENEFQEENILIHNINEIDDSTTPEQNIEENKFSISNLKEKALLLAKEYEKDISKTDLIKSAFDLDNTNSYINSLYIQSLKGKNEFPEIFLNFNYSLDEKEKQKINPNNNNNISEKEKFNDYITKLENINSLDDIFIFSSTQNKLENPFDRIKYLPNKPIDINNDHLYFYYINLFLSDPSIFLHNQYFKSVIIIIKTLYEKNERVLLYSFLHDISDKKKSNNFIICIYYLLYIYVGKVDLFKEVYLKTEKMLSTDILDLLIKESINFSNYFEKIKPIFIECLKGFLNSKLMHSAYDLIIKKEKIASLNEETISYFLDHISFKPLFNYKEIYSIYPEPLEIVVNIYFTFKDLHALEIQKYYLLKLNNLFFSIISSIQEFLTYYKYYIHPNKNHIRILEKKMETIKKVNVFKDGHFNLKKTNFVFNSFNWNKDLNTFNNEIEKCIKLKNEVYLGDYFEKFCNSININEDGLKEILGNFKKGEPDNQTKKNINEKKKEKLEKKEKKLEKQKEKIEKKEKKLEKQKEKIEKKK